MIYLTFPTCLSKSGDFDIEEMMMKLTKSIMLMLAAGLMLPALANAAPTITFEGEVSAQTCEAK